MSTNLTAEQSAQYQKDGFLVVEDLLSGPEVSRFLEHVAGPKPADSAGLLGHTVDPQYRTLATHPKIVPMVRQLIGGSLRVVQTMYLNKAPRMGKGIALHQDSLYLPNEPNTLMACWIAMTDTDPDNGGLCVVPGSHKTGLRTAHKTQNEEDHAAWDFEYDMRDRDGREWKQGMFSFEIDDLDPASILRLTVPKGGGVFFTGLTIHGSYANRSADRPRNAFATHYVREGTWLFRQDVQETMAVDGLTPL